MHDDTIAAISTPLGEGGIGIVRLSGGNSLSIADRIFSSSHSKKPSSAESRKLTHGFIRDPDTGTIIDEVLITVMRTPHTYTREDIVEINCHGGFLPLRKILELTLKQGARLADPGEFTKRAFLNGRIDLAQAEAVMDLIRAKTDASGTMALKQLSGGLSETITALRDRLASVCAHVEAYIDFPEEDIEPASLDSIQNDIQHIRNDLAALSGSFDEGRFFREGIRVAIVGRPNVGKSSLLNALLRQDRAIVTETAGTTRDVIEEYLNIKGLLVRIMDTAGIRETHEMAEQEGVQRSLRAIEDADVVIGVLDGNTKLHDEDTVVLEKIRQKRAVIAINKSDLLRADDGLETRLMTYSENILPISATRGLGLEALKDRIIEISLIRNRKQGADNMGDEGTGIIVTNLRHKIALDNAETALARASRAFMEKMPLEITAVELREALDRLGEIVGAVTTEDILDKVFREFCIGK